MSRWTGEPRFRENLGRLRGQSNHTDGSPVTGSQRTVHKTMGMWKQEAEQLIDSSPRQTDLCVFKD